MCGVVSDCVAVRQIHKPEQSQAKPCLWPNQPSGQILDLQENSHKLIRSLFTVGNARNLDDISPVPGKKKWPNRDGGGKGSDGSLAGDSQAGCRSVRRVLSVPVCVYVCVLAFISEWGSLISLIDVLSHCCVPIVLVGCLKLLH